MRKTITKRVICAVSASALVLSAGTELTGCAVAVLSGVAAGGALVATAGRRSSETAGSDASIENQIRDNIERALTAHEHHVTVTSYYRKVLLTGEVSSAGDKALIQAIALKTPEVVGVVNSVAVMPPSGAMSRAQDAFISSKVLARFLRTNGVPAASIKVVTERGNVYIMGRLTRMETEQATHAVQLVSGVQRVSRVIDIVPDSEIQDGSSGTLSSDQGSGDISAGPESVNDEGSLQEGSPQAQMPQDKPPAATLTPPNSTNLPQTTPVR